MRCLGRHGLRVMLVRCCCLAAGIWECAETERLCIMCTSGRLNHGCHGYCCCAAGVGWWYNWITISCCCYMDTLSLFDAAACKTCRLNEHDMS
jgi:hypothetical protein